MNSVRIRKAETARAVQREREPCPAIVGLRDVADLAVRRKEQIAYAAWRHIHVQAGGHAAADLDRHCDRLRCIHRVRIAHRHDSRGDSRREAETYSMRTAAGCKLPDAMSSCAARPPSQTIQGTDEASFRLSEPSASLYASTVCVCDAPPLAPCAMETGPTVDDTRRNRGAACKPAAHRKPAAASAAAPFRIRPTPGPLSLRPDVADGQDRQEHRHLRYAEPP